MLRQANCVLALAPYLGADFYHRANYFFRKNQSGRLSSNEVLPLQ